MTFLTHITVDLLLTTINVNCTFKLTEKGWECAAQVELYYLPLEGKKTQKQNLDACLRLKQGHFVYSVCSSKSNLLCSDGKE